MVTAPAAGDPARAPRIDATLVRTLVAGQFPEWAGLPVRPVEPGGWDNRTFRLGEDLTVRLLRFSTGSVRRIPRVARVPVGTARSVVGIHASTMRTFAVH